MVFIYFHDQGWVFFTIIIFWCQIIKSDKLQKPHPDMILWQIPADPITNIQTIKNVVQGGGCSVAMSYLALLHPRRVARQTALALGFPRQEYWSGLLFPSPGDLADPGSEPSSSTLAGGFFTMEPPRPGLSNTNSNALSFNF